MGSGIIGTPNPRPINIARRLPIADADHAQPVDLFGSIWYRSIWIWWRKARVWAEMTRTSKINLRKYRLTSTHRRMKLPILDLLWMQKFRPTFVKNMSF